MRELGKGCGSVNCKVNFGLSEKGSQGLVISISGLEPKSVKPSVAVDGTQRRKGAEDVRQTRSSKRSNAAEGPK